MIRNHKSRASFPKFPMMVIISIQCPKNTCPAQILIWIQYTHLFILPRVCLFTYVYVSGIHVFYVDMCRLISMTTAKIQKGWFLHRQILLLFVLWPHLSRKARPWPPLTCFCIILLLEEYCVNGIIQLFSFWGSPMFIPSTNCLWHLSKLLCVSIAIRINYPFY